ncbi:hypothetical protein Tco_0891224 [Tanacetum coccineum]|uniref:Uncharacterized protein n=1 Tax=Tanacetum coccineum TaxID=301880 RepID=A0ABQ5C596_9ASTR
MVHNYYLEEAKKKEQLQKDQALDSKPAKKAAQSHKTTKRYIPVEKKSDAKKPERRIYTGHRWIPTGKTVGTCLNSNDSAILLGKRTCIPNTVICANSSSLIPDTSTASEPISSKGTDIAKITRKRSKPDKHGHGNGKSAQEPEVF